MAGTGHHIFDKALLQKALATSIVNPPKFYIGVDAYDGVIFSYCLMRKFNETIEVILAKTTRDEELFNEEVENLVKYFEAEKVTEQ